MNKFSFVATLLAVYGLAQEAAQAGVSDEPTAEDCPFLKVFEQNDAGQWQLKPDVLPLNDLPQLSFTDVDEQAVADWIADKESAKQILDQKWLDAWTTYQDAIAQPLNQFMDRAADLSHEFVSSGMKTDAEVVEFIAENTFVDGQSLADIYPKIGDFLAQYRAAADNLDRDDFRFDAYTVTPRNLQVSGYFDEEGNYHPNQAMVDEYEQAPRNLQVSGYFDEEGNYHPNQAMVDEYEQSSEIGEQIFNKLEQAVVSYGYDPEVVQAWLADKTASWDELQKAQDAEMAAMAQADVAEAAEYIKSILDNARTDFQAMLEAHRDAIDVEAALNEKIDDLKVEVDAEAQANIDRLAEWLNQALDKASDFDVDVSSPAVEAVELSVMAHDQAETAQKTGHSGYALGLGIFGAAAVVSYLHSKRQSASDKTATADSNEPDEGFVQV